MNLLEFRQFFRGESGRYDMVNSSGVDIKNTNTIINAAQKYLDRLADLPQMKARRFIDISAGDWLITFTKSRSILEAWCIGPIGDDDATRLPLTVSRQQELRGIDKKTLEQAYVNLPSQIDQGRPTYYTPADIRLTTDDGTTGGIGGFADVLADGYQTYNGVVLMPPSDNNYTIEIFGNFYSDPLTTDTDKSFWSEQHPMILHMAVMRQLEIIHRNSEGRRDWEEAIMSEVSTLDMDGVAQDAVGSLKMEG